MSRGFWGFFLARAFLFFGFGMAVSRNDSGGVFVKGENENALLKGQRLRGVCPSG